MAAETNKPADGEGTTESVAGADTTEKPAEQPVGGGILGDGDAQTGEQGGEPKGQDTTDADPYESVKLPEGAEVDKDFFGDLKGWAKENQVKPEALTKLAEQWGKRIKESAANAEKSMKEAQVEQNKKFVQELRTDKEFGGAKFEDNKTELRKFLNKVDGDKSFRKELVKVGVDNWPPLVKFLFKLAKANANDTIEGTTDKPAPTPATDDGAFYDAMYPTMKK